MKTSPIDPLGLIPAGSAVLCAVSGGADSVYLLCRVLELAGERGLTVRAAHYNHRLRADESDRDERFVRDLCFRLGVSLTVGAGDVAAYAAENGLGTEEAARKLRYAFLEKTADAVGAQLILTAHTADDNAETMLMNLARGAGLAGLCGIPPKRGRIARPMLETTRAEVESYLAERGIPHVEDSTNAGNDYARNRVRHTAVPVLRGINPDFAMAASRAAALMRQDEEFLASLAREFLAERCADGVPARELTELPRPVSSRVVRLLCGTALSEAHTSAILALAGGEGLGYADVPGLRVTRQTGKLYFGGTEPEPLPDRALPESGILPIPEAGLEIEVSQTVFSGEINSSLNTFFFNYETICGTIFCTSRRSGDRIKLAGRNCTKKLSDLFGERKLTQTRRALTPVLRDSRGVVAVGGFGMAERCVPRAGDRVVAAVIRPAGSIE